MTRIPTDGLLFDLDGTLWDSSQPVAESWNQTLARFPGMGRQFTAQDVQSVMGLLAHEVGERLLSHLPPEKRDEMTELCVQEENDYLRQHGGRLYEGLEPTLAHLKARCPLFIVSNCQVGYIEAFLHFHRLGGYFRDFVGAGHTGLPKSDNIALMVRRHGLRAPVYLGDTLGDCRAAKAAGVPFLHAAYGFGDVPGEPRVPALSALPEFLCSVQGEPF